MKTFCKLTTQSPAASYVPLPRFLLQDEALRDISNDAKVLYALLLAFLMLLCNLRFGQRGGVAAALGFSLYGYLLNPETIRALLDLPAELMYRANVAVGWLSPLNHATYHMHNFGYDLLPRLWQTEGKVRKTNRCTFMNRQQGIIHI